MGHSNKCSKTGLDKHIFIGQTNMGETSLTVLSFLWSQTWIFWNLKG